MSTATVHPAWCEQDKCFEGLDDAAIHGKRVAEHGLSCVELWQTIVFDSEGVTTEPIIVALVYGGNDVAQLPTAADCRDMASVLIDAADALEAVNN